MRYAMLIVLFAAGCTTMYDAQVEQSRADSAASAAAVRMAEEQSRQLQILAESAKQPIWPWVLVVVVVAVFALVALLLMYRAMQITATVAVAHRLLPGDAGWDRALLEAAMERDMRVKRRGGEYYLVDGEGRMMEVKQLTVKG